MSLVSRHHFIRDTEFDKVISLCLSPSDEAGITGWRGCVVPRMTPTPGA